MIMKYNFIIKSFLKKKKLFHFCIKMFTIIISIYLLALALSDGIKIEYNSLKEKYIKNSYITLNYNKSEQEVIEDIRKYSINYYKLYYYNNLNYEFIYAGNNLINLISGNYIENINDVVVSKNLNKNINDIITISIDNEVYNLKIVGIYEQNDYRFSIDKNISEPIFSSLELMKKISDTNNTLIVQIDYDKKDEFINKLYESKGYNISIYDKNTTLLNRYSNFSISLNNLSKIMILFVFTFICIVTFVIIHDNKYDIAIMKSMGYSNFKIIYLITLFSYFLLILSFVLSLIIVIMMSLLLNILHLNLSIVITCFINLLLLILLIVIGFIFKIRKKNIITLIKD